MTRTTNTIVVQMADGVRVSIILERQRIADIGPDCSLCGGFNGDELQRDELTCIGRVVLLQDAVLRTKDWNGRLPRRLRHAGYSAKRLKLQSPVHQFISLRRLSSKRQRRVESGCKHPAGIERRSWSARRDRQHAAMQHVCFCCASVHIWR